MSDAPLPCHDSPCGDSDRPRAQGDKSYPNRLTIANSDDAPKSPWSKKLVLSLDGGGVRGYSSLLILRRLLCIIADLESGNRNDLLEVDGIQGWTTNHSSAEYPWRNPPEEVNVVACEQDPGELGRSNAPPPDVSTVSLREERSGDGEAVRHLGPTLRPPSHRSGAGSKSSNTSSGNKPVQEGDSWAPDTLVRFRVHHYFDYVVGTSTGGLSTLMLSRLGMDIDDALRQYTTVGNGVFAHRRRQVQRWGGFMRPKYASANMNSALQTVVEHGSKKETIRRNLPNDEIRLLNTSEQKSCRTAVIAFGGPSNESGNTYVFRSYDRPDFTTDKKRWLFNTGDASIAKVWEVARATSAAPLYFSKHTIDNGTPGTYIDGGMGCNNPAELMSQEVDAIHGRVPELILSIGTGTKPPVQHGPPQHSNARRHKLLDNFRSVFHVLQRLPDIVTESEDCHIDLQGKVNKLRQARSYNSPSPSDYPMYFRFNVPGLGAIKLDAWESTDGSETPNGGKTLQELEAETRAYLNTEAVRESMEACAKELVLARRERAKTERWEQFATHTFYRCPLKEEHECKDKLFSNREQLRSHAAERHEFVPRTSIKERPSSITGECPEDSHICIMDQCEEAPQVFRGADALDQMLQHLRGPAHIIKNPQPKAKPGLEAYLDEGRTTLDAAFQEEAPLVSTKQPDPAQQPHEGQSAGAYRSRWKTMFRSRRRTLSGKVDSQSIEQAARNTTGSSRERNGSREPPARQEGHATRQTDNNTTDSHRQQVVQLTCAESYSSPSGEAEGRRDGSAPTSQHQQPQHRQPQAPNTSAEQSAVVEPFDPRIDQAADHHNCDMTNFQHQQPRRLSVQQSAGAERFLERDGNAKLPLDHEPPVSGRLLPSLDHATKHIFHRRVQSI